jgi:hypothetical protein
MQPAMRPLHIVICGLSPSTKFFHIISKTARFSKKVTEYKMCVLIFSTTFVRNISHSKKKWPRYDKNVHWSPCTVPFILVRFELNLNLLDRFSKNPQIPNFMKIRPVGAKLFHADGWTERRTDRRS